MRMGLFLCLLRFVDNKKLGLGYLKKTEFFRGSPYLKKKPLSAKILL